MNKIVELLEEKGYKVWEKYGKKRIYIDDFSNLLEEYLPDFPNPKAFRRTKMYYDILEDKFVYECSPSMDKDVLELINNIRSTAEVEENSEEENTIVPDFESGDIVERNEISSFNCVDAVLTKVGDYGKREKYSYLIRNDGIEEVWFNYEFELLEQKEDPSKDILKIKSENLKPLNIEKVYLCNYKYTESYYKAFEKELKKDGIEIDTDFETSCTASSLEEAKKCFKNDLNKEFEIIKVYLDESSFHLLKENC